MEWRVAQAFCLDFIHGSTLHGAYILTLKLYNFCFEFAKLFKFFFDSLLYAMEVILSTANYRRNKHCKHAF
jgi:hypothetical protein